MNLPITQKPTNTGAIELFDANGVKIGTIRTSEIQNSAAINKANADFIVNTCNSHEKLVLGVAHLRSKVAA